MYLHSGILRVALKSTMSPTRKRIDLRINLINQNHYENMPI